MLVEISIIVSQAVSSEKDLDQITCYFFVEVQQTGKIMTTKEYY